jgi:hypothetical protein
MDGWPLATDLSKPFGDTPAADRPVFGPGGLGSLVRSWPCEAEAAASCPAGVNVGDLKLALNESRRGRLRCGSVVGLGWKLALPVSLTEGPAKLA